MKTIGKVGIMLCLGAAFSYAETWTGKLLDASCYDAQKATTKSHEDLARACTPTAATTDFAIQTADGKVYKVGPGTSEFVADVRNGILKKDKDGDMHARVTGKRDGDTVKVDAIILEKKEK
jgi:hypothetical protein